MCALVILCAMREQKVYANMCRSKYCVVDDPRPVPTPRVNVRRVVRAKQAGLVVERLLCNGAVREMRREESSAGAVVFVVSAATLVMVWVGALFLTGLL